MKTDDFLLSEIPDYICLGGMLKATPKTERASRILYLEASNEDIDRQNEIVLQKALSDSADYYLRHGNIDISHFSLIGPKAGVPDYMAYEIGKPVAVKVDGTRTFVKAELYQGESPMAKNANIVWESLTKQTPPARWYASVGGSVLSKAIKTDENGNRIAVVDKVRWNNTALDRCPVNKTVGEVSTVPIGVFAKSLNGFVLKGLSSGYETDSALLTGGEALRKQSLEGSRIGYIEFRNRLASLIRAGKMDSGKGARGLCALVQREMGLSGSHAAEWVDRFLRDLKRQGDGNGKK